MFQQLILIGNLGRDPEMRYTSSGVPVTTLNVAVNRKWTNTDGTPGEETTWFRVSAWRKQAETVNQYLKKGSQVMVVGRVAASAYSGQDGSPRASLEVTADVIKFLGGNGKQVVATDDAGDMHTSPSANAFDEEDIPF